MLLRICLIVAILGGGAVVAVNYVMVKPAIETVVSKRDEEAKAKKEALGKLKKSQDDLAATKTSLTTANNNLTKTTADLAAVRNTAEALLTKYTDSTNKLAEAQGQRDKLQADMVKWDQTHIKPEDVPVLQSNLVKATKAREGVEQENSLLLAKVETIQGELDRLRGPNDNQNPQLPPG